jgi:phage baseplate assembly protein W
MAGLSDFVADLEMLRRQGDASADGARTTLEALIARGQAVAAALADLERGVTARVAVPYAEVLALATDLESFIGTYFGDLDYPAALFAACRAAQEGLYSLHVARRFFGAVQTASAAAEAPLAPSTAPYVAFQVRRGDTLERIALETLGDPSRWPEIAAINQLVYPYTEANRDFAPPEFEPGDFDPADFRSAAFPDRAGVPDGVAVTGEFLWLPPDAQVPVTGALPASDRVLYGVDLALADGVLALSTTGEPATVEGLDNLVQALRQRIGTAQGELVLHPDYGMRALLALGAEGTRANVIMSGLEVARTVLQDPRVTRVRNLEILFRDTINSAAMRVGIIGPSQRDLPLNLVIPPAAVGAAA